MSQRKRARSVSPRPKGSLEEAAYLTLQRIANRQAQELGQWLREWGLTSTQYNVLRILRGARPDALRCSEIAERMVTGGPDVTRLVDRLVRDGRVSRLRSKVDRRVVEVEISSAGLKLLSQLDRPILAWHRERWGALDAAELESCVATLQRLDRASR